MFTIFQDEIDSRILLKDFLSQPKLQLNILQNVFFL